MTGATIASLVHSQMTLPTRPHNLLLDRHSTILCMYDCHVFAAVWIREIYERCAPNVAPVDDIASSVITSNHVVLVLRFDLVANIWL